MLGKGGDPGNSFGNVHRRDETCHIWLLGSIGSIVFKAASSGFALLSVGCTTLTETRTAIAGAWQCSWQSPNQVTPAALHAKLSMMQLPSSMFFRQFATCFCVGHVPACIFQPITFAVATARSRGLQVGPGCTSTSLSDSEPELMLILVVVNTTTVAQQRWHAALRFGTRISHAWHRPIVSISWLFTSS